MKLHIHPDTVARLTRELAQAGRREIGGVLVGEHLDRNTFRIADLSVQRHGGDNACFVRRPAHHKGFLDAFFASTGDAYDRFNYLGEWHSHPSFSTEPSGTDLLQMHEIVNDGPSAPPFAILLIVRLGRRPCWSRPGPRTILRSGRADGCPDGSDARKPNPSFD